MTGKFFAFASVLTVITVVLVTIESKNIPLSSSASRNHNHPSRGGNLIPLNHELQDTTNGNEHWSYQTERKPSARRKREDVIPIEDAEIRSMEKSSICKYSVYVDIKENRNPMEITHVNCITQLKKPCGTMTNYFCNQAIKTIDVQYDGEPVHQETIHVGCICALNTTNTQQVSQNANLIDYKH